MRRVTLGVALGLVAVTLTGCGNHLRSFYIPSGAMENTLRIGDHIGVKEHAPIVRGSVIVFVGPSSWQDSLGSKKDFVKRVIGLPGDHVVCCNTAGLITVNGQQLNEPYLYPGAKPSDTNFDVTVPAGRYWVMGDHRNMSADSRAHISDGFDGTIPKSNVIGVVVKVLSPKAHAHSLPTPQYD